jgi:AraC-like DNA-binding protein/ligand-binding sensor protein
MRNERQVLDKLRRSQLYKDYEQAFTASTQLPLTMRAMEYWQVPHEGQPQQNPFCALVARKNKGCAACLETSQKLAEAVGGEGSSRPVTVKCFAGLCDSGVPLRFGNKAIGMLQTGQVALEPPSRERFKTIAEKLIEWGAEVDLKELEEAYFESKVLTKEQYEATLRLLDIFAHHLSDVANKILTEEKHAESPLVKKVRTFLENRYHGPVMLEEVAKAMRYSTFYFCKLFKKATGITFTDFLNRVRVEKAKNLLENPHLRVNEVAFEVGFQSLPHFNRVFRKIVGVSPSEFREKLRIQPGAA